MQWVVLGSTTIVGYNQRPGHQQDTASASVIVSLPIRPSDARTEVMSPDDGTNVDLDALRAQLAPWMAVLRANAHLEKLHRGVVWLSVVDKSDERLFEALELLALAGGVSSTLWKLSLYDGAGQDMVAALVEGNALAWPVGCEMYYNREMDHAACERLVSCAAETNGSAGYIELRRRLEGLCTDSNDLSGRDLLVVPREELVVPIQILLSGREGEPWLRPFARLVSIQAARERDGGRICRGHNWKHITRISVIRSSPLAVMTPQAFQYVTEIARCGVDIKSFSVKCLDVGADEIGVLTRGLQALLRTTESTRHGTTGAVKTIGLPTVLAPTTVAALFSALLTSQSVRSIGINQEIPPWYPDPDRGVAVTHAQRDHLWRWLAFAVFGRRASHRIEELQINISDLSVEAARAFCEQLQEQDVIPVYVDDAVSMTEAISGSVVTSRFHLTNASTVELDLQSVFTLGRADGGSTPVLLPGCGRAWVTDCSAITSIANVPAERIVPVKSLRIGGLTVHSKVHSLQILQHVGRHFTRITLHSGGCVEPLDEYLCSLLEACPHLEELTVLRGGKLTSLDMLVKSYERGICRLQKLSLRKIHVLDMQSVDRLFQTLRDNRHPMTRMLRELVYEHDYQDSPPLGLLPPLLSTLDAMLHDNSMLQKLTVKISAAPPLTPHEQASVQQLVDRHTNANIAVDRERKCRLAFLSVARRRSMRPESGHEMDELTLRLVFAFATTGERRSITLTSI